MLQGRHSNPPNPSYTVPSLPLRPVPRTAELDPEERRERINESMARFMQFLTFFGHVDNFLTQKTHGLIKMMGKAVDSEEDEEIPRRVRYRKVMRPYPPKIQTTTSSE